MVTASVGGAFGAFAGTPFHGHTPGTTVISMASGETLRVLLERAQLSPEQLAHNLDQLAAQMGLASRVDRKTPYKWLRGSVPRRPWPALVSVLLSQRLNIRIQPHDIWQVTGSELVFVPASIGLEVPWTGAGTIAASYEVAESSMIDRRVFLQLTGAALTQPAFDWLLAQPAADVLCSIGRRVTNTHVDSIDAIISQLHHLDDQFGGGAVLDLVKGQIRFVLDLLHDRSYTSRVGTRLHGAAAELLWLAGWVSFDAGQHAQAQRYWIAGLHAAHSAGDRATGANILAHMSYQAEDLDLRADAVRLADAARQGYSGGSPRLSAFVSLKVAAAYAGVNDRARCEASIDTAYEEFRNQTTDTTDPSWSYWIDEARINDRISYAYAQLGEWPKAQRHMAMAVRMLGNDQIRDGAVWRVFLANTHAHQGEPERASEVGLKAIEFLSQDVTSARGVAHLHGVHEALSPYRKLPAVRDFRTQAQDLFVREGRKAT